MIALPKATLLHKSVHALSLLRYPHSHLRDRESQASALQRTHQNRPDMREQMRPQLHANIIDIRHVANAPDPEKRLTFGRELC